MTPVLDVSHLIVSYGDHTALDNVDLQIRAGEVLGLIGPNGAGKTSLIKSLCGRVTPASGTITVQGQTLLPGQSRIEWIGLVPQDIGLYDHMSGEENLSVFAQMAGVPKSLRNDGVQKAIQAVDMAAHADKRVSDMSGGMQRRINVAAAILHDPDLVIFDEPTAGVDIPARDTVHRLIKSLSQQGKAVLIVTHELDQAESLCDRICILGKGQKLADAAPGQILQSIFKGARETRLKFGRAPEHPQITDALRRHGFQQAELPTIWSSFNPVKNMNEINAFLAPLGGHETYIREVSVRRPGLETLIHHIERTGRLP